MVVTARVECGPRQGLGELKVVAPTGSKRVICLERLLETLELRPPMAERWLMKDRFTTSAQCLDGSAKLCRVAGEKRRRGRILAAEQSTPTPNANGPLSLAATSAPRLGEPAVIRQSPQLILTPPWRRHWG
jgi:hypothetical protein